MAANRLDTILPPAPSLWRSPLLYWLGRHPEALLVLASLAALLAGACAMGAT